MKNPWLTQPDPYFDGHPVGYEGHIQPDPKHLEFERLAYETFIAHPDGQKLYERIVKDFIGQGLFNPMHPNADKLALYFEGFKEAFRGIYNMALNHQRRILEQK